MVQTLARVKQNGPTGRFCYFKAFDVLLVMRTVVRTLLLIAGFIWKEQNVPEFHQMTYTVARILS